MTIEVNKGDEELVTLFEELKRGIEEYTAILSSVADDLGKSLIHFSAIMHPTAEIKIRAISYPPMDILSRNIGELVRKAKNETRYIISLVDQIEKAALNRKMTCNHCDGNGKIRKEKWFRDEEVVKQYSTTETCPECKGSGCFAISDTTIKLTNELIKGLCELKQEVSAREVV